MSIIKSGHFGSSEENIVVIKNFISKKHLDDFYNYTKTIKNYKQNDGNDGTWSNRIHLLNSHENKNSYLLSLTTKYIYKLKKEIEDSYNLKLFQKKTAQIVVWREGDYQPPHADKENVNGSDHPYPDNDIASLMYLNDDYRGGSIFFPNQKIQIKPEAGSAIFFPGDKYYLHGVSKVTRGQRFTIPCFWQIKSVPISEDTVLES